MSLRRKTVFVLGLMVVGLLIILYVTSRTILVRSFISLERESVAQHVQRIRKLRC